MSLFDPEITLVLKKTGGLTSDQEWIATKAEGAYPLSPDEVLEVRRLELIPPVNLITGLMRDLRWVSVRIGGKTYETIHIDEIMAPLEGQLNVGVAIDFGIPYLWRPFIGRLPTPHEGLCPKAKPGQEVTVAVKNTGTAFTEDFSVILRCARVRTLAMLMRVLAAATIPTSFTLQRFEEGIDTYTKPPVLVALETFNELPGGLAQAKPQIWPWITSALNAAATTPNTFYEFYRPDHVVEDWEILDWNLVEKSEAYVLKALSVWPHANSKAARMFISGRVENPEFSTRPLPEWNYFMPPSYMDTSINADLKRAGPFKFHMPILFHGVKGGPQVVDNGTAITANGVKLGVWGTKYVLK